jgi:hypothetical protein
MHQCIIIPKEWDLPNPACIHSNYCEVKRPFQLLEAYESTKAAVCCESATCLTDGGLVIGSGAFANVSIPIPLSFKFEG